MHTDARSLIAPFYDALNNPAAKDVPALVTSVAAPEWRSYAGETQSKSRDEFIAQAIGFGKLIPDLAWTIKDVLVAGDRIIVRSEATGTPAGDFFGVPHTGRSFRIMTIDIHTVADGRLVAAHHVEDWAGAIRQLSGR
jgi:predicted ester cyclase